MTPPEDPLPIRPFLASAVSLLRASPAKAHILYGMGTIPFLIWSLWFAIEVACRHTLPITPAVLLTGFCLYCGMKTAHALFSQQLCHSVSPSSESAPSMAHLLITQSLIQPSSWFFIPLASLLTIPIGWVHSFYENATLLGGRQSLLIPQLVREAWKLSLFRPKEYLLILWLTSPALLLMTLLVSVGVWEFSFFLLPKLGMPYHWITPLLCIVMPLSLLPLIPLTSLVFFVSGILIYGVIYLLSFWTGLPIPPFLSMKLWIGAAVLSFFLLDPLMKAIHVRLWILAGNLKHFEAVVQKARIVAPWVVGEGRG